MKTVFIDNYGGPEVLQYSEVEQPVPKADEMLIKVKNAGVSPFDLHMRDGWYKNSSSYSLPIILGWELAGDVVQVGADITQFKVGDAVFAHPSVYRNGGAYAEYVVIKEAEAALKPASVNYEEAAAASMNALTAWQALFDTAHLSAGQKILIHAGAGGVGHLAIQLAKWKGAYVITTASAKNKEFLLNLGADEVIDYNAAPFEKTVNSVDVVLDTIGGETLINSFRVTKKGGIVVSIVDFEHIKEAANYGIRGENVIVTPNPAELSAIAKLLEEGKLKVHVAESFPLKEASKAHQLLQDGHIRGKVLLKI